MKNLTGNLPENIPADTHVFRFNESLFFPNSHAVKTSILDSIQTYHAPAYSQHHGAEADRTWSVVGVKRVARLRRKAQVLDPSTLPPMRIVVLDFTKVNHIDTTAVSHLRNLVTELRKYAGEGVQIRFVGMTEYVRLRFERSGWQIVDAARIEASGNGNDTATVLFPDLASAVHMRHMSADSTQSLELVVGEKGSFEGNDRPKFAHKEQV